MNSKLLPLLKYTIGWPLSLLALFFILKIIYPQRHTLLASFSHIHWVLFFLGIISFNIYFFMRGLLWYRIQQAQGEFVPWRESLFLWATSELKRYIPGSIFSLIGRTLSFSEKGVSKKKTLHSLLLEAQLICIGPVLVGLLAVPYLLSTQISSAVLRTNLNVWLTIIVLGLTFLYIFQQFFIQRFSLNRIPYSRYLWFPFPFSTNGVLMLISSCSFFFFGLGYYFSLISLYYIDPQYVYALVGLFVLAYLIGYLSFITPTGVGVREGIIIFGLSRLLASSVAALASIFTRIILILSELIFVGIVSIIYYLPKKLYQKLAGFSSTYRYELILFSLMAAFVFYFSTAGFLRYDNFYTGRFDLGNMSQTVWNTAHGRIFQLTDPNGTAIVSRLATHADFILILLAPFYHIWSNPKMLILIQTIISGSGAIFIYLLGKDICKNKLVALVFAGIFLLNPSLERATLYDFHPVTLATTFLLGAFYYLRNKQVFYFALFAILAVLTKEEVWFTTGLFGVYMAVVQKKRVLGATTLLIGIGMSYFLIAYAIPHALGSEHFALSYYSDFGDKPSSIIKTILFSPMKTFGTLFAPNRLTYLRDLFSPLGYLSFLAPFFLIFAVPDFIINLLSNNTQLHQIYYQYTATITPFLFIAAIYGFALIRRFFPQIPHYFMLFLLLLFALKGASDVGPLPGAKDANLAMFTNQLDARGEIQAFLAAIPKRYSVAASNNVGSHLSERRNIYTLPLGVDKADYIVILDDPTTPQQISNQKQLAIKLKNDPTYIQLKEKGNFIAFRKRSIVIPHHK